MHHDRPKTPVNSRPTLKHPAEVDPLVFNMLAEDPGPVSYQSVGGLAEQIRGMREVPARDRGRGQRSGDVEGTCRVESVRLCKIAMLNGGSPPGCTSGAENELDTWE